MKKIKILLIVFLISLPFWLGVNAFQENIEEFFYAKSIEKNPPVLLTAQISHQQFESLREEVSEIKAEGVLSVFFEKGKESKVLFEKQKGQRRPIASLTKLMTAIVALDFYRSNQIIKISKGAVSKEGKSGNLRVGETLKVKELIRIMMIESSNDAAFSLTEPMGEKVFVDLMNIKAKNIGLQDTHFYNSTGLDPENYNTTEKINFSTPSDLIKILQNIIEEYPDLLEIISLQEYQLYLENGIFHHNLQNTNELLGETPKIIGGKTGYTKKAGGCLATISKGKKPQSYFLTAVLNSTDRFGDTKKLINAYYGNFGN